MCWNLFSFFLNGNVLRCWSIRPWRTGHHHSSHWCPPPQQHKPHPVKPTARYGAGGQCRERRLYQHIAVQRQPDAPPSQPEQPHPGFLHDRLQQQCRSGPESQLQLPPLLPSFLLRPGPLQGPQRGGAGVALLAFRGLLSGSKGPSGGPRQPQASQSYWLRERQPRAGQ